MKTDHPSARAAEVDARAVVLAALCSAALFAFTFLDPLLLAYFREADPALVGFWRATNGLGNSGWMIAACLAAAFVADRAARAGGRNRLRPGALALRRRALFVLACVAGLGTLAAVVKLAIGRARPKLAEALGSYHFEPLAFDFKLNSLPSGHATTLFALATALALITPRWRPVYYAVALWGAVGRVASGAHYLSDVILGAALGHYGTLALARLAAARRWPVAMADAPIEGRAALRASRRLAAGTLRHLNPARAADRPALPATLRQKLSPVIEALHARYRALVRRRRADA